MNKNTKIITAAAAGIMVLVFAVVLITGLGSNTAPRTEATAPSAQETQAQTLATEAEAKERAVLSFIGDCIIGSESGKVNDGNFSWMARNKEHEYFFQKVYDVLKEDDLTVANVECVLTDRDLEKTGKDYSPAFWFKAPAADADILTKGSVEFASIVNNHTYDYGEEGYKDTVAALKAQGMYVGESLAPVYVEKNGIKIGIVCCNLWASYQTSYIEDALKDMQDKCEYKIVIFHGGTEAVHEPDNYKIDACRYLANSGFCDLIVGSHPHVLQPLEVVNGVPILYSLGNFCYSANNYPENKTVIFQVQLERAGDKIITSTRLIPCYVYTGSINAYQPAVMTDAQDINEVMAMMETPVEHQTEPPSTAETSAPTEEPQTEPETVYVPDPTEAPTDAPWQDEQEPTDYVYSDTQVFPY